MSKLLIVDDEFRIRELIKKYALYEGHEVDEAENGVVAVSKCRNNTYDLIIMDIMMPELDGFGAVEQIRKFCNTPIIMLSARGEEYDRLTGFEAGVDDYVIKPFSPKELMMRVAAVLRRSGSDQKNDKNAISMLKQHGDFRSAECIELLKEADIVITNPPFSLFREYIGQLMKYEKKFVIVGHQNAITYKEIFPLIKDNKIWLGYGFKGGAAHFFSPYEDIATAGDHRKDMIRVSGVNWFTNLEIPKRHDELDLIRLYSPEEYPQYDNYDAINVDKTSDIPCNYPGAMGVPITFLDKYNPEQFEIITLGIGEGNFTPTKKYQKFRNPETKEFISDKRDFLLYVRKPNGKYLTSEGYRLDKVYARIIIRNKHPKQL